MPSFFLRHRHVPLSPPECQIFCRACLGDIIGTAAQDTQLQLIKTALTMYFKDMPRMDQRAMMAAGTRFCVHGEGVS